MNVHNTQHHHTQVYLAGARGPEANLVLLDNMLTARHQLGTLLGFNSYAAFRAADGTLAGGVGLVFLM